MPDVIASPLRGLVSASLLLAPALGALVASTPAPAAQQLPRLIDCGDLNGYPEPEQGYELLSETSAPPGVTLAPPPLDTVHVAAFVPALGGPGAPADVLATDGDQLGERHRLTALQLADLTVLSVSGLEPHALHRVRLELGALSPWVDPIGSGGALAFQASTVSTDVRVQVWRPAIIGGSWRTVAERVRCATGHRATTWEAESGSIVPLWTPVRTDGEGVLRVRLSTDGSDPLFLSGVQVHAYEALPVVYRRGAAGPLVASSPALAPFAAAFNAGDLDEAEALASALPKFERGVALTHLAGWLDGGRDGRLALLAPARAALAGSTAGHPAARWLLDEIDTLQRALDHVDARGYSASYACPGEGGRGFLNPDCWDLANYTPNLHTGNANAQVALRLTAGLIAPRAGATVLHDLVSWNQGAIAEGDWEPSPLVFAAAKLAATTMIDMNPLLSSKAGDPLSEQMAADRTALCTAFVDLGFAATDFPRDLELRLFAAYAVDGHPFYWPAEQVAALFTDAEIDASWWGPHVAAPAPDPAAPPWVADQRQHDRIARAIGNYWLQERRRGHELGGGWGDDVELLAQLFKAYAGRQDQGDRRALDAIEGMVRYGMGAQGDVQDGYHVGPTTDVEHSAEYTTNPHLALRGAFGHSALAAGIGLGVARHLRAEHDPAHAFAGETSLGRLHFKSFVFSSGEGPSDDPAHAFDLLLDGRAMLPATALAAHASIAPGHPLVADLSSWAAAWRDDADSSVGGKPLGWHGPVKWPTNQLGANGVWYSTSGQPQDDKVIARGDNSYTLELLRTAYRRSTAPDRWRWLVPAARIFRSVMRWEDGAPAPVGSGPWAGSKLYTSGKLGALVIAHLGDLAGEPQLSSQVDPSTGAPYVDAALLERMRRWVEVEIHGQGPVMRYVLGPVNECGAGPPKGLLPVANAHREVVRYYRAAYPLLTTHVMHTDRVLLNYQGAASNHLLAATTGEMVTEGMAFQPLWRWTGAGPAGTELAVLCNERPYDGSGVRAFAYHAGPQPLAVTLVLDEGLAPGRYRIEMGPGEFGCDGFPAGAPINALTVDKRGAACPVPLALEPGLSLVRATRLGAAPPAARYELAADPPIVTALKADSMIDLLVTARVVNLGSDPSPPATARLLGRILHNDGSITDVDGQTEHVVAELPVPALPGLVGWTPAEHRIELAVPVDAPLVHLLTTLEGGFELRLLVEADGTESDLVNNDQRRGWMLDDIEVGPAP